MGFQNGFRVNTNTSAVNTYRSYSAAQSGLERNIERLSSGLRINRAADDTAGLAISNRMSNQVRGMQQSNRNVQQANNMLQSAEGGLNEIHGILSRMRELAVQAASDGMNADDRASIELEYSQLKAEITRIGHGTEYNSMKLIDGSRAKDVDASSMGTDQIASYSVNSNVATNDTFDFVKVASGEITLRNTDTDATQTLHQPDGSGFTQGDILNFDDLGLTIELGSQFVTIDDQEEVTAGAGTPAETHKFSITQGTFTTVQVGANNDAAHSGAYASDADDHGVTENRITFNISDTTSRGLGIEDSGVSALANAQRAVNELDAAIEKVNDERGNIGSLQNRFEFTSANLMNSIQNNSASMSTIRDADFAVEAADLARNQILTQSGTAMLAQANQISQNVLSLLR